MDQEERLKAALADRYEIKRQIGSGGMATVYLAEDLKHDRRVALKVLKPELVAAVGTDRFLAEIRTTANLQHPHILPLFDSGEAGGFLYYVMPHVEGESLRGKLDREKQLPVKEAIGIAKQAGAALDYAHDQGVIHRDVKPENILLHRGEALVADFGIALALSAAGGTRLTETGLSVGTPHYMSPEQAAGERELDGRSDLYSLGAVVYEMLAGSPPFTGSTSQAIIAKVLSTDPEPLSRVRRSVPGNVEAAVAWALAKIPADRFTSGAEFELALTDPGFSSPSGAMAGGPGTLRRWKRLTTLGFSAAGLFAALALWAGLRQPAVREGSVAWFSEPFPSEVSWEAARQALAIAPDGERFAYAVSPGVQGGGLFVRPLDRLDGALLDGTEGALDPFFSPDGRWIGFATIFGLHRVLASGGPPAPIADFPEPRGAAWTEEDLIYFGSTSGLWRVPASGGVPEQVTRLRGRELLHNRPRVLPNGRDLVFTIASGAVETTQVAVYASADGVITTLFPGLNPRYVATGHLVYGRSDGHLMAVPFDPVRLEVLGEAVSVLDGLAVKPTHTMDFALSDEGTLVYLQGTFATESLVLFDRSGQQQILPGAPRANLNSPRYSPDGTRIVVGLGYPPTRQVWVYEASDSTMTPITFEGHNYYPVWDPRGGGVAYTSETADGADLRWTPSDGSGTWEILLSNGAWNYPGAFSPDGRFLIYREQDPPSREDSKTDLMVLPLEGDRTPFRFLDLPSSREEAPAISPDGRWLAYASDLSGKYEVYVNGFPDPGRRRKISVDGGHSPVWSRDGRELFYKVGDALVSATVSTSTGFDVLARTVLFHGTSGRWPYHADYDVAPDGRHFVMTPGGEVHIQLVTVLNWFNELEERLGEAR